MLRSKSSVCVSSIECPGPKMLFSGWALIVISVTPKLFYYSSSWWWCAREIETDSCVSILWSLLWIYVYVYLLPLYVLHCAMIWCIAARMSIISSLLKALEMSRRPRPPLCACGVSAHVSVAVVRVSIYVTNQNASARRQLTIGTITQPFGCAFEEYYRMYTQALTTTYTPKQVCICTDTYAAVHAFNMLWQSICRAYKLLNPRSL